MCACMRASGGRQTLFQLSTLSSQLLTIFAPRIFLPMTLEQEIAKRRTFGIISHPDAGKTTLTEKLLLFGGAIQKAGAVKSSKIKDHARSDWMEIEKQRGISVATSVMGFNYKDITDVATEIPRCFSIS